MELATFSLFQILIPPFTCSGSQTRISVSLPLCVSLEEQNISSSELWRCFDFLVMNLRYFYEGSVNSSCLHLSYFFCLVSTVFVFLKLIVYLSLSEQGAQLLACLLNSVNALKARIHSSHPRLHLLKTGVSTTMPIFMPTQVTLLLHRVLYLSRKVRRESAAAIHLYLAWAVISVLGTRPCSVFRQTLELSSSGLRLLEEFWMVLYSSRIMQFAGSEAFIGWTQEWNANQWGTTTWSVKIDDNKIKNCVLQIVCVWNCTKYLKTLLDSLIHHVWSFKAQWLLCVPLYHYRTLHLPT